MSTRGKPVRDDGEEIRSVECRTATPRRVHPEARNVLCAISSPLTVLSRYTVEINLRPLRRQRLTAPRPGQQEAADNIGPLPLIVVIERGNEDWEFGRREIARPFFLEIALQPFGRIIGPHLPANRQHIHFR